MIPWRYRIADYDEEKEQGLVAELGLHPVIARVLCSRGIESPTDAEKYLNPSLDSLHDPFLMLDMDKGVDRIVQALRDREKILIHGDFDADGLTATAILEYTIKSMGGTVFHFIPNRLEEGYGLRKEGVEEARRLGVKLLITCDCGITSSEAVSYASEHGIDTIITDHHQPDDELPRAVAVIDPHRPGCNYPFKGLAGVGVAAKLVLALLQRCDEEPQLPSLLRMCAIGTIADVVPLIDENRVIAHHGLALLPGTPNIGLKALMEVSGLKNSEITAYDISFRLAPRINAMGRFGRQDIAMDLFFTRSRSEAAEIAATMDKLNAQRQRLVDSMVDQALEFIENDPDMKSERVLVVSDERWHKGVVGIVASKLVETFNRPVLAIAIEDDIGVGSGRSIEGFHLLKALAKGEDLFSRFGGHAMAAGFELPAALIPELRRRMEKTARAELGEDSIQQTLQIDTVLNFNEIDELFEEQFSRLEPLGYGNTNPLFMARGVRLIAPPRILKEKHVKLRLEGLGRKMTAIAWRKAEEMSYLREGDVIDLIYSLYFNNWRNERKLEIEVKAISESKTSYA